MKRVLSTKIVVGFTFVSFLSVCLVTSAHSAGPPARASSEPSISGLTPEKHWDQQQQLHEWLMSELPDGTLDAPIRVPLTKQDRHAIANDQTPFPRPQRVGIVKRVGRSAKLWRGGPIAKAATRLSHGVIRGADDGGFAWAVAFESDGASALRVHLSDVSLPDTADIYFFTLDGQAHGPYRGKDAFWSNSVMGSQGIVLIRQFGPPAAGGRPMSISVSSVGNIDEPFVAAQYELCSYNAECIEDAEPYGGQPVSDLKAATARMRWAEGNFMYSCSGGLLADSIPFSQIPYFLTANHCLKTKPAAASLELYWNYTTSNGSCAGPEGPVTMGATIKAKNVNGDFTLLELDQSPPAGSVFMGWNSEEIATTSGVRLHRVSHPKGAPQSYATHVTDADFPTCGGLPIPKYIYSRDTLGSTEAGSSGSLIANDAGEVVGQLYGGCGPNQDECFSNDWRTVDGAFAFYYDKVAEFLASTCDPSPEICDDGVDNDCDTDIDCDDSDCIGDRDCESSCEPKNGICSDDLDCCSMTCKPSGRCR
jgi:V8-like Glu-specific endopeptidase